MALDLLEVLFPLYIVFLEPSSKYFPHDREEVHDDEGTEYTLQLGSLDARDDLAWALGCAECFDEALAEYLKLIADYERVMGVDDPDTLTARNNYICTLKNSGKIVEAVALYRELLSDVERALGADDEFAQEIAQRLSKWES